jgi:glycosyltransferase involved in cell wall biosynthesis
MRIAVVSHSNAPWTRHYARAFLAAGHETTVISYHPVPVDGVRTLFVGGGDPESAPKWRYVTSVRALRRILRGVAPDVVLATYVTSNGLAAALAWDGPLVVSARGGDALEQESGTRLPAWLRARLLRFVCRRAVAVHAVSAELVEALRGAGIPSETIVEFPIGVDADRFRAIERTRPVAGPLRMIGTRAHDVVYHNEVILDAFARLRAAGRDLRLDLVGDGPLLDDRRRQAERLGVADRVRFLPRIANDDMPALLREADIYVSASSSDGTSASLLEALATGLLPIVTRIRANEPWVSDGVNGFLFGVGDAADLARVVVAALGRDDVRDRARTENPALVRARANLAANNTRMLGLLEAAARGRS